MLRIRIFFDRRLFQCVILAVAIATSAKAQMPRAPMPSGPPPAWMNTMLSAEERADLVLKQMTLAEKIAMMHGTSGAPLGPLGAGSSAAQSNGGAGYFGGVSRLNIPAVQMADASYGVTHGRVNGRYSTALPSPLASAASWDPALAFQYGALIGKELRNQGYNMSLGGGINLAREPRNGRTFEYQGEDPLLAGTMVGQLIKGTQSQHIIGDIKHYALNDQESGRNAVDITISERAMRETDLLAFEIGIRDGEPGAVMCSYNRVDSIYACENPHLISGILKGDWKFKGFVLSDWGGTHSTINAFTAGLDNEEPSMRFFGEPLLKAVSDHDVTEAQIDEHVSRILRTMFANGIIDYPMQREVSDISVGLAIAQSAEEQSIVLLKNRDAVLPLTSNIRTIALIGGHADIGMVSGGGSAQVDPSGGNAVPSPHNPAGGMFATQVWFPESPLQALKARFPEAKINFDAGNDLKAAAAAAQSADVAIVFGWQWESEAMDLDSLALSGGQNELIAAVTAANPHAVVVLETGGPVTMPWVDKAAGIVEVWYGGSRGAEALARVLAGDVNPSAKLPITFPLSDADLPHPTLVQPPPESRSAPPMPGSASFAHTLPPFAVTYNEGLKVGYKWYDAENKPVLFPFGFGLSYTHFAYSDFKAEAVGDAVKVQFTVTNKGQRVGSEIAQVYAGLPEQAGEPPKRLVAWKKLALEPGASQTITMTIEPQRLSMYDVSAGQWKVVRGSYVLRVGGSSKELPLSATVNLRH